MRNVGFGVKIVEQPLVEMSSVNRVAGVSGCTISRSEKSDFFDI